MDRETRSTSPTCCSTDVAQPIVLLVGNDPPMGLCSTLEEGGWHVEEACCGQEALSLFGRLRPDLVILDLSLTGTDGLETCSALRGGKEGKYTPILAMTSLHDVASIRQAFEAGATDFIHKPVSSEILEYRTRYLLRTGRALAEMARNEADLSLLKAAVESLPVGITISDANGRIIYTNPSEAAMHGFEVSELLHRDARALAPQRLHRTWFQEKLEKCGVWRRESVNRHKRGEEFQVQLSSVSVRNPEGEFLGIVTACEDITERKKNEAKIHRLAYYDTLTGLPNRTLFHDRLQKALAQAKRSGTNVAVLFLDLDNFKDINDTQGHDFGDNLLREVAQRLSGCIREADTLARMGGDEFVIMLPTADGQEKASITAQRILETFRVPFNIDGRRIFAAFSIGIAHYPDDAPDMEILLRNADTAMYQAKARGRQNYQFFSPRMNRKVMEKVALESALREALDQGELTLFYQPQWDLQTGRNCGVEVLLRWHHHELGEISPTRFIPLAENSGQILHLGEWTLRSACSQASAWVREGRPVERVAVNISAHQLHQPEFPDLIERILDETELAPERLELEFTESVLMDQAEKTISLLQKLKRMGMRLSIDDFGTGYSSLNYLKHFPIDRIKIDRSFIAGIDRNPGDTAIVEAVIALARTLNIRILAEGVETSEQLEFLKSHGCEEVQGFFLGTPMRAEELTELLDLVPEFSNTGRGISVC